jgi:hypothetical protein
MAMMLFPAISRDAMSTSQGAPRAQRASLYESVAAFNIHAKIAKQVNTLEFSLHGNPAPSPCFLDMTRGNP